MKPEAENKNQSEEQPELRLLPEENAVRPLARMPESPCRNCGGILFERMPRYGFWQEKFMPFFNRYPWRCTACARMTYRNRRSVSSRR